MGGPPGKHTVRQLRTVIVDGQPKLVVDRREYWGDYYDANHERIRAKQNAHMRRKRAEAKAKKEAEGGGPVGTS